MPCYSRVTETIMTHEGRLAEGLEAQGWIITEKAELLVTAKRGRRSVEFTRRKFGDAFSTTDLTEKEINPIQKKYSEIGVRAWAEANRFSIVEVVEGETTQIQLVDRSW